jgi:hypothetical protein
MAGPKHEDDPQPEPPPSFVEPRRVQKLVQQMKAQSALVEEQDAAAEAAPPRSGPSEPWTGAPKPLLRTCVASMANSRRFGPMVAAEAQGRDFYRAQRRAFVADGLNYNWTIWRVYFRDFEPIVDFVHVLCYVYLAAYAVGSEQEPSWSRYVRWLRACWQGRVSEVLDELALAGARLGAIGAGEEVKDDDPREVVRRSGHTLPSRRPYSTTSDGRRFSVGRKYKAGPVMPRRQFSPQELQHVRELAAQGGRIVARHAFGDDGPGTDVDLDALEQPTAAAAAGLTEGTLATLLEQQAQRLGDQQPCPTCGRLCPIRRAQRPLQVRAGPLTHTEPLCHCPDCRRDFFPPTAAAAPRRPRLQPRRPHPDRSSGR